MQNLYETKVTEKPYKMLEVFEGSHEGFSLMSFKTIDPNIKGNIEKWLKENGDKELTFVVVISTDKKIEGFSATKKYSSWDRLELSIKNKLKKAKDG